MKVLILTKNKIAVIGIILTVVIVSLVVFAKGLSVATISQNKLVPIYNVKTDEKKVAISFDAA